MKRKLYALLCVLLALALCLCACKGEVDDGAEDTGNNKVSQENNMDSDSAHNSSSESNTDDSYWLNKINILLEEGENYIIYTDEMRLFYTFEVWDNEDHTLDKGYHDYRFFDICQDGNFVKLVDGSGMFLKSERYYDVSTGRISRYFEQPVASSIKLVAYFDYYSSDDIRLVVRSVFDDSYYKEIKRNFSDFVIKTEMDGEFLDDSTKLKLTYWITPDNEEVTEIFDLASEP